MNTSSPNFEIKIINLPELQKALQNYPSIATPILQNAIVATQAIIAKMRSTRGIVPVKSGYLVQDWGVDIGNLMAKYYPKARYAGFVEFGTRPHEIRPVTKKVLANRKTGQIFGKLVHHPGTRPNPFMERIIDSAKPEIDNLFKTALEKITQAIASQAQATV